MRANIAYQCPESSLQLFNPLPGVQHRGANRVAEVRHHTLETNKDRHEEVWKKVDIN